MQSRGHHALNVAYQHGRLHLAFMGGVYMTKLACFVRLTITCLVSCQGCTGILRQRTLHMEVYRTSVELHVIVPVL